MPYLVCLECGAQVALRWELDMAFVRLHVQHNHLVILNEDDPRNPNHPKNDVKHAIQPLSRAGRRFDTP